MRKIRAVVGVCVAAFALGVVPNAAADHRQDPRWRAISAKLNCLTRTPATVFVGFMWSEEDDDNSDFLTTALDWDIWWNDAGMRHEPDLWLLTVKNTRACKARFAVTPEPRAPEARALTAAAKFRAYTR